MSCQEWAYAGDTVGGFSTLAALLYGMWSFRRWRAQHFEERRAAAAAAAYVAMCQACDQASQWADAWSLYYIVRGQGGLTGFASANARLQTLAAEQIKHLGEAARDALPYLEDAELELMDEPRKRFLLLRAQTERINLDQDQPSQQEAVLLAQVFEGHASEFRDVRAKAEPLRKAARLGQEAGQGKWRLRSFISEGPPVWVMVAIWAAAFWLLARM